MDTGDRRDTAPKRDQAVILEKTDVRYTMRVSLPLDRAMQQMAERMNGDAGKVVAHALTVLAIIMEHQRKTGGHAALVVNGEVVKRLEVTDTGLPGDLEIVPD